MFFSARLKRKKNHTNVVPSQRHNAIKSEDELHELMTPHLRTAYPTPESYYSFSSFTVLDFFPRWVLLFRNAIIASLIPRIAQILISLVSSAHVCARSVFTERKPN